MNIKPSPITRIRLPSADPVPAAAGQAVTRVTRLSVPGSLDVEEAGPRRLTQQDVRANELRDTLKILEQERKKLRGHVDALEDLRKLAKPNLALVEARREGLKYQRTMVRKLQAQVDELVLAQALDRCVTEKAQSSIPVQVAPPSLAGVLKRALVLENRRALLVELAKRQPRVFEDAALTEIPEHLRPRRLDENAAPSPLALAEPAGTSRRRRRSGPAAGE